MNVHKLKVKMRTLINALNSHKSFISNPFNHSIIENQVKAGREGEARRYNTTVNKIDFPSSLLAEILPLCAFTIAYTTESPIPKPPVLELWEASIR